MSTWPWLVAGGAGMAAGLAAAKAGASVVVLEAFEHFAHGNNTAMSTSMIPAAGTRWQRSEGVDDSAAVFLADIAAKTKDRADPTIAKALVEVGPRLVDWLDHDWASPWSWSPTSSIPGTPGPAATPWPTGPAVTCSPGCCAPPATSRVST